MKFWDTSAIVPLLIPEARTSAVDAVFGADRALAVWWATEVECMSAIARQERREDLSAENAQAGLEVLVDLARDWIEMQPNASLRRTAGRLVRTHDLRAGDAFQLAAAVETAEGDPRALPFVTLDLRLADAARREGFSVIVPGAPTP